MDNKLIKQAFNEVKKGLPINGKCPDENDLACFAEGIMEEKEQERIEQHILSCPTCCNYVVSLNKVIHFSEEKDLPEIPTGQLEKVSALVEGRDKDVHTKDIAGSLTGIMQSMRKLLRFDWMSQPLPVAVKSAALTFLAFILAFTTFFYYQKRIPLNVQMEVVRKSGVETTRGIPGEAVEKIISEGDTLFSNDFCRINFEIDRDGYAYVLLHDSTGQLHQLYPDPSLETPQRVQGKVTYTIPEGENNWFRLNDTVGTETVFVLASKKPMEDLKENLNAIQHLGKEELLELFKTKANVLKVLSFKHQ